MERKLGRYLLSATIAVPALLAGGLLGSGIAIATESNSVTYSACLSTLGGALYNVTSQGTPHCLGKDKVITWNQAGPQGLPGTNGTNGNTILNGTGVPASSLGNNGDFYLDTASEILYGPKAGGAWPAIGTELVGKQGLQGPSGVTYDCSATPYPGVDLATCPLAGANLTGANLAGANLAYTNLNGANLDEASLIGANLTAATLQDANLESAPMVGANLTGADLMGADLSDANLGFANLTGADLQGATLTDADLGGVTWSDTICPDGTVSNSDGGSCS